MHATQSICNTSVGQATHYDFGPTELISLYVDEHVTLRTIPFCFRGIIIQHTSCDIVFPRSVIVVGWHSMYDLLGVSSAGHAGSIFIIRTQSVGNPKLF